VPVICHAMPLLTVSRLTVCKVNVHMLVVKNMKQRAGGFRCLGWIRFGIGVWCETSLISSRGLGATNESHGSIHYVQKPSPSLCLSSVLASYVKFNWMSTSPLLCVPYLLGWLCSRNISLVTFLFID
jgi:hypothetical protein